MSDVSKLKRLCNWLKEEKGITEISVEHLVSYDEEYEEWLVSGSKKEQPNN